MSKEINESHIYLFLADYGDKWQKDADKMDVEDDQISLYEFKKFLGQNWNNWEGVSVENIKADVVRNFFEGIDKNVATKADLNRLDKDELASMEGALEAYKTLNDFITEMYNTDYPKTGLDSKYGNNWKWDLTDPLTLAVNQCIEEGTTDYDSVRSALENVYDEAYKNATAQCYVAQYTDSAEVKNLIQGLGYTFNDDTLFQSLVLSKIGEIDNVAPSNIKNVMEQLVKDYLATAGLASGGNANNIEYNKGKLNDIQKAKFAQLSGNVLNGKLNQIEIKDRDGKKINLSDPKYADAFNSAKTAFTDWYSKNATRVVSPAPNEALFDALVKDMQSNWESRFEESGAKKVFETEAQMIDSYVILQDGKSFTDTLKEALPEDKYNDMLKDFQSGNLSALESKYPEYFKEYNKILQGLLSGNSPYIKNGVIDFDAIDKALLGCIKVDLGIANKVDSNNDVDDTRGDDPINDNGIKTISIDNLSFDDMIWGNDESNGHLEVFGALTPKNETQVSASTFRDLYNNNAVIQLHVVKSDGSRKEQDSIATQRLGNLVNMVKGALASTGQFDENKLAQACNSVTQDYINNIKDLGSKNTNKNYDDDNGYERNQLVSEIQNNNYSGIVTKSNQKSGYRTKRIYLVSFKQLVDDIIKKYNSLI